MVPLHKLEDIARVALERGHGGSQGRGSLNLGGASEQLRHGRPIERRGDQGEVVGWNRAFFQEFAIEVEPREFVFRRYQEPSVVIGAPAVAGGGMFLGFWLATHGNRYWRMALVGSADGVPLRRSWRLVIVYAQYLMFNIAISITFLVLAAISQVVAVHATSNSGESLARLMVYVMVVGGLGTLVWAVLGVRFLRRVIEKDATRAST